MQYSKIIDLSNYCREFKKGFSAAEDKFTKEITKKGWKTIRNGWPDFLIYKDNEIAFVEVKRDGKSDKLKRNQVQMLTLLTKAGFKCYVWKPNRGLILFNPNDLYYLTTLKRLKPD